MYYRLRLGYGHDILLGGHLLQYDNRIHDLLPVCVVQQGSALAELSGRMETIEHQRPTDNLRTEKQELNRDDW